MCLRYREQKLPAFKDGTGTSSGQTLFIHVSHTLKRRIRGSGNALGAEFCVHIVVNPPQPAGQTTLPECTVDRIGLDVF
jgi:hypothetical protein